MIKLYNILLLFIVITAALSCKKENRCDCLKRTGDIVTETRTVPPFDRIYAEDNVNVYITQDSVFEVKVEAGKHLIELVKTEVSDGQIKIMNKNRCNWARSYKPEINVYLHMPSVKYITSDATGNIKSLNTITTPQLDYRLMNLGDIELTVNNQDVVGHMHGAGDVFLHGNTYHHACNIVGNGFIHAEDLETNYTWILSNTSGNTYVRVHDLLQVSIAATGDIIYTGQPNTIDKVLTGKGRLIAQ